MSLRVDPLQTKPVLSSVASAQPENDACCRTYKLALPIIASLASFVFLPFEFAIVLTGVVAIATLLCNGCIDAESVGKMSQWMPPIGIPPKGTGECKSGNHSPTHRPLSPIPEHEEVNRSSSSFPSKAARPNRSAVREHESVGS